MAEEKTTCSDSCQAKHRDEKEYRDEVSMSSFGSIDANSPDYDEGDDVGNAMAEAYY